MKLELGITDGISVSLVSLWPRRLVGDTLNISLMFVPCIVWLSVIDQQYAPSSLTPLFYMQAPTHFSTHVPSSGSFSCPCELPESRNVYVVFHILWVLVACVHWLLWLHVLCCPAEHIFAQLDNITHGTTTTSAHRPPTLTVYDTQINISAFK
jgi:hypothetical protein